MQVSQEAGKVVWYSHLLKNFSQFIVIQTVKGFKQKFFFLEFPCFLYDPMDGENLTLVPLTFLNPAVHLEVLSSCTAEA